MVNVTSISHLVLFMCHLFIDGHFRTAQLLYNPKRFELDWLLNINRICPESIPLYLVDMNQQSEWTWNDKDSPDNVLQLNFIDPTNFIDDINQLSRMDHAYYCIFCFPSSDLTETKQRISTIRGQMELKGSKALFASYNSRDVSISMHMSQPILVIDNKTNFSRINLYDQTFGEYERRQSFAIQRVEDVDINDFKSGTDMIYDFRFDTEVLWMHFYHLQLNSSFMSMTLRVDDKSTHLRVYRHCTIQPPKYYKELTYNYQCRRIEYP